MKPSSWGQPQVLGCSLSQSKTQDLPKGGEIHTQSPSWTRLRLGDHHAYVKSGNPNGTPSVEFSPIMDQLLESVFVI